MVISSRLSNRLIIVCTVLLAALNISARDTIAKSMPQLHGRVEHSEFLQPVAAQLRVGNRLQPVYSPHQESKWFQVPPWLAGKWRRGQATCTVVDDFRGRQTSGKPEPSFFVAQDDEVCGYQKDRSGKIWHCLLTPYQRTFVNEKQGRTEFRMITRAEPVKNTDDLVQIRRWSIGVLADSNGRIIKTVQREEDATYRPKEDGTVLSETSTKVALLKFKWVEFVYTG